MAEDLFTSNTIPLFAHMLSRLGPIAHCVLDATNWENVPGHALYNYNVSWNPFPLLNECFMPRLIICLQKTTIVRDTCFRKLARE